MDLEIHDSDDNIDYTDLDNKLKLIAETDKNNFNKLILIEGDELVEDMERRKRLSNEKKRPYIEYIVKKSYEYDSETLFSFELDDVMKIYYEIKELKMPIWKKILRFLSQ